MVSSALRREQQGADGHSVKDVVNPLPSTACHSLEREPQDRAHGSCSRPLGLARRDSSPGRTPRHDDRVGLAATMVRMPGDLVVGLVHSAVLRRDGTPSPRGVFYRGVRTMFRFG